MTEQKLTELGFTSLPKENADATAEAMFEQVENNPDLAEKVLGELHDWHAPHTVHKDNYDDMLEVWVFDQTDSLHGVVS